MPRAVLFLFIKGGYLTLVVMTTPTGIRHVHDTGRTQN